jgi:hypothetical protein
MLCNLMTEPFDLNAALADAYIKWQKTYLTSMLQRSNEHCVDYCDRMCCLAFMEGAKTVQGLMQQAFVESLAETMK